MMIPQQLTSHTPVLLLAVTIGAAQRFQARTMLRFR